VGKENEVDALYKADYYIAEKSGKALARIVEEISDHQQS